MAVVNDASFECWIELDGGGGRGGDVREGDGEDANDSVGRGRRRGARRDARGDGRDSMSERERATRT